jgi:hypothetical protein
VGPLVLLISLAVLGMGSTLRLGVRAMTKHIYATLVIVLLAANLYATTKNSQAIAKAQADIDDIESFTEDYEYLWVDLSNIAKALGIDGY